MCGLAGFTRLVGADDGRAARAMLERMLAPIAYRGPDATGFHLDDGIALGHLRLTVIAPEGGAQPRVDAATGDALAFNGEIYGYRAHAEALMRDGVVLRDRSDTEVLFQMIRREGVEGALDQLDGMFAFVYRDGASAVPRPRVRRSRVRPARAAQAQGRHHQISPEAFGRAAPAGGARPSSQAWLRRAGCRALARRSARARRRRPARRAQSACLVVQPVALETMLRDHASGRRDHRKRLWALYCLFRFASTAAARA